MKNQKPLFFLPALVSLLATLLLNAPPSHAQTFNFSGANFPGGGPIPDGNAVGISSTEPVSGLDTYISEIKVTLNITGDFNGDLYVELRKDSAFSVLLNRTGLPAAGSSGYADNGFNITLSDSAANDIHNYRDFSPQFNGGGQLTGEWRPDGSSFSSFQGLNPNGDWTLVVADLQNFGNSTIQSWGLQLTVIPEPHTIALTSAAALFAFALYRRSAARRTNR